MVDSAARVQASITRVAGSSKKEAEDSGPRRHEDQADRDAPVVLEPPAEEAPAARRCSMLLSTPLHCAGLAKGDAAP